MRRKPKKIKLELEWETADGIVIAIIKDSIKSIRSGNKNCATPADLAYEASYIEACKIILQHFGAL